MKFSVLIPTYNRAQIVLKALNSVLNQSFTDFEVLIIDNGSTDNTREVIESAQKADPRIIYHWQENTGSPAGSRNTGIHLARGDWLAFLDSDDVFYPEKLERVDHYLKSHPNLVGLAHGAQVVMDERVIEHRSIAKGLVHQPTFDALLFQGNFLTTSAVLVKGKILEKTGGFNPAKEFAMVEDYDLWLRVAKQGDWGFIDQCLTTQSAEPDQLSRNIETQQENLRHILMVQIQDLNPEIYDLSQLTKRCHARVDYYKGKLHVLASQHKKAIPSLWSSILIFPWKAQTWWFLIRALLRF